MGTDGQLPPEADAITIQALEVAADGHSAIWGAVKLPLFLKVLGRHPHGIDEAHRAFQRTPDEAMRNYLLTMYFVFRLFYETTWNSSALTSHAHARRLIGRQLIKTLELLLQAARV